MKGTGLFCKNMNPGIAKSRLNFIQSFYIYLRQSD